MGNKYTGPPTQEAETSLFSPNELREYEDSKKAYRDIKNSIDTALERGHEEGLQEGMKKGREERETEIARNLLGMGMSVEQVSKATGLSVDFLKSIS